MYHIFPKHGRKRPYTGKIRSFTSVNAPYTISVFRRISAYTITVTYDRNTVTCNTAKYDRIRSVYGMYTVVYGTVYDRLRQYQESVTIDLGIKFPQNCVLGTVDADMVQWFLTIHVGMQFCNW
jgi:hypothetical protein